MNLHNETAQKVLECASEIFAEKGYSDTSISDICGRAEANRAAVNYYFRSKQALYEEVFKHAWDCFCISYPLDMETSSSSEQKLKNFISSLIYGIFDPDQGGWFMKLMFHEAVSPSEKMMNVVLEVIVELRGKLDKIIAEITSETDQEKIHFMNMSVMSQCLFFNMTRNIRKFKIENKIPPFDRPEFQTVEKMKELIDHSYQFCLSGLLDGRKPGE